jgi:hypothetical protein
MVVMRCGMRSMAHTADDDRKPHDGANGHDGVNGHDDEAAVRRALLQALAAIEGPRERVDGILMDSDDGAASDDDEPRDERASG